MRKDYYVILGVASDATQDEIRSAYREQTKTLHPDHHGQDSEPFLDIQEAYSVLSNPRRRHDYDESRSPNVPVDRTPFPRTGASEPIVPNESPAPGRSVSLFDSSDTYGPSIGALFDRLWADFAEGHRPKSEGIRPVVVEMPIAPEEASSGGSVDLTLPILRHCTVCGGRGSVGPFECWRCGGAGKAAEEVAFAVSYPEGVRTEYTTSVPLGRYGIRNTYLSVRFRVTGQV